MDSSGLNEDNYSGSEQKVDNSIKEEDDKSDVTQGSSGGEESRREASVVNTNVDHEHLRSRTSTSGNDNRKRRSQSSYPVPEKVSGLVWKAEPQPQEENLPVQDSAVREIKTEPSSIPNVETVPYAKTIKTEPPSVQCPIKSEDRYGMSSYNNSKDDSNANISSGSTSTDEVEFLKQVMNPTTSLSIDIMKYAENFLKRIGVASGSTNNARASGAKSIKEETFIQLLTSTSSDDIKVEAEVFKSPNYKVCLDYSKINKSKTLKTSEGASSSTNVALVPEERTIKHETTSADASSSTNVEVIPDVKNIKNEPAFSHLPVKRENKSGMSLNNDGKDNSKPNISSASTSSEEVEILEEHGIQDQSLLKEFFLYLYRNRLKCPFCDQMFLLESLMKVHILAEHVTEIFDHV